MRTFSLPVADASWEYLPVLSLRHLSLFYLGVLNLHDQHKHFVAEMLNEAIADRTVPSFFEKYWNLKKEPISE